MPVVLEDDKLRGDVDAVAVQPVVFHQMNEGGQSLSHIAVPAVFFIHGLRHTVDGNDDFRHAGGDKLLRRRIVR